ncbi:MAG: hypothetical protein ACRD1L_09010, partial [Terriglobales bacterium]
PAGFACRFSPAQVPALSGSVQGTVQIQIGANAAPGQHLFDITASSGALVHRLALAVTISPPASRP